MFCLIALPRDDMNDEGNEIIAVSESSDRLKMYASQLGWYDELDWVGKSATGPDGEDAFDIEDIIFV